ncbi:MAG: tetratricopeptide repeat protein [Boseongicola sp.]
MQRRLAAILAADVVGYTKLVQADEAGTLHRLRSIWAEVFEANVSAHRGRIFKTMGDGTLAEFASAVDAVNCAVAIQDALRAQGFDPEDQQPIEFRIGVNLGEVVVEGDDILGDGVNVAARLESAAPVGGVLISASVYAQVRGKTDTSFTNAGEVRLKNISEPLQVWRWESEAAPPQSTAGEREKLSIAVLPFNNMSADPEQEFLADGLSEDIITGLSKIRWFLVIARNSTFTYKGQAVDIKRVAAELGVRYVLEGSVRKSGNRIRVTAQLIDAATGLHVWAENYDRELADIFDLQDEITKTIVGRVEPEISAVERSRAVQRRTENLGAWECYQRGLWHMWNYAREEHKKALELLTRATQLDSNFSTAFAYLGYAYYEGVIMGWQDDPDHHIDLGMQAARNALRIDDKDPIGHFAIGRIYMMRGEHDASIAALQSAIDLNPSFSHAHHGLCMVLMLAGQFDDARAAANQVIRLSPRDPILWATTICHALADILDGNTSSAFEWIRKTQQTQRAKGYWMPAVSAAALVQSGRPEEGRAALQEALTELPSLTVSYLQRTLPTKHAGGLDPYTDALRAAGLPE